MTTTKQGYWIHKMLAEKTVNFTAPDDDEIDGYTTSEASALLKILFDAPKAAPKVTAQAWTPPSGPSAVFNDNAAPAPVAAPFDTVDYSTITEGFYLSPDDEVIKIVPTRDGERHYGKVLEGTTWSYLRGAIAKAAHGHRITIEEAAKHGWATGHCLICGKELTVVKSVQRGIGPVCWKRLGGSNAATTLPARETVAV